MDQLPAVNGVLVLDKPQQISSASAVERVRRALRAAKAGHGGTLDPLASGVLPICLGQATRLARFILSDDKAYVAEGRFGVETDTLDRSGQTTRVAEVDVTRDRLEAAIAARIGEQDQIPPQYSALKVDGARAYKAARRGEFTELAPRRIRIDRLELVMFEPPRFAISVACGKGTYIRSLIADLGTDMGCGAHLTELRRTRAGRFSIEQAVPIDQLDLSKLIAIEQVTDLPKVVVDDELIVKIRNGIQMPPATFGELPPGEFELVSQAGALVSIAHVIGTVVAYDLVVPVR